MDAVGAGIMLPDALSIGRFIAPEEALSIGRLMPVPSLPIALEAPMVLEVPIVLDEPLGAFMLPLPGVPELLDMPEEPDDDEALLIGIVVVSLGGLALSQADKLAAASTAARISDVFMKNPSKKIELTG